MDFKQVAYAVHELSCTQSKLVKEGILRKYRDLDGFKDVLKHIYNPYVTTGIQEAKLDANAYPWLIFGQYTPEYVLEYFSVTRTGNASDLAVAVGFIARYADPIENWLATGIVTKTLRCGVSTTTLNNVYGKGFIPIIGIMRGKLAPDSFQGVYIATEKIDGNRRLFFNYGTHVDTYTRSGHRETGLKEIESEILKYLPAGYIYDCECIKMGDFADNIALRQATASVLNSNSTSKVGVKALCFDMIPIEQYNAGESYNNAIKRKAQLAQLFGDEEGLKLLNETQLLANDVKVGATSIPWHDCMHIAALPILAVVHNKREAMKVVAPIWETHGEGIMLVDALSTYKVSATPQRTWLKVKQTAEFIAKVINVYEGKSDSAFVGTMGGITVAFLGPDKQVYQCNVGSGFSVEQRDRYFNNPEAIIGKLIEGDCFGFSQAANTTGYSLNCPIFKRIKGEVD